MCRSIGMTFFASVWTRVGSRRWLRGRCWGRRRPPQHVLTAQLLRELDEQRPCRPHPGARPVLALEPANHLDRRDELVLLVEAVSEPEQRLRLRPFFGVVGRRAQLLNRASPLLVGNEVLGPCHPSRVGRRTCGGGASLVRRDREEEQADGGRANEGRVHGINPADATTFILVIKSRRLISRW